MSTLNAFLKRSFDLLFSIIGIVLFGWLILIGALFALIDTKISGFFIQERVGKNGKSIKVIKLRTMRHVPGYNSYVTTDNDPRVSTIGNFLRKSKIDELPQLINVLLGQMSFVGPRPDLPGFADQLTGDDRVILTIRPGITGPASLKYKREEELLARQDDPEKYNKEVIYPDKVQLNKEYIRTYKFHMDIKYIIKTIIE